MHATVPSALGPRANEIGETSPFFFSRAVCSFFFAAVATLMHALRALSVGSRRATVAGAKGRASEACGWGQHVPWVRDGVVRSGLEGVEREKSSSPRHRATSFFSKAKCARNFVLNRSVNHSFFPFFLSVIFLSSSLSPFLPRSFEGKRGRARERERESDVLLAIPRAPAPGSPPGSLDAAAADRELARRRRGRDDRRRRRPFPDVDDCTELPPSRRVRRAGSSAMVREVAIPCFPSRTNCGEEMRASCPLCSLSRSNKRCARSKKTKIPRLCFFFTAALTALSHSPLLPLSTAHARTQSTPINKKTAPRRSRAAPPATGATSSRRCLASSSAAARQRRRARSS